MDSQPCSAQENMSEGQEILAPTPPLLQKMIVGLDLDKHLSWGRGEELWEERNKVHELQIFK